MELNELVKLILSGGNPEPEIKKLSPKELVELINKGEGIEKVFNILIDFEYTFENNFSVSDLGSRVKGVHFRLQIPRYLLKELIQNGLSVNTQDVTDWTPVHIAVRAGDVEFLNFLLKFKPDLSLQTDPGYGVFEIIGDSKDVIPNASIIVSILKKYQGKR